MKEKICGKCVYYERTSDFFGDCHRYPPKVNEAFCGLFTVVSKINVCYSDSCGEYRSNKI